ncbi:MULTISPECIES: hypothetical protein [unclassified Streptomyces]|uniref:hypothetical protein n=1 Tax=unclassified Streptomyces TaxID=2593676 RepID=UPI003449F057
MDTESLVSVWRRLLTGPGTSWVLFEHGTCVVLTGSPEGDLAEQATGILGAFGPVRGGSAAGDFGVIDVRDADGWVVTGHHRDVLTYVAPGEPGGQEHVDVGLCGRSKRHRDGTELGVVHVEDRRGPAGAA